jgi:hypothetical protein
MKRTHSRARLMLLIALSVPAVLISCNPAGQQILNSLRDDDGDLWFTEVQNQRVELFLTSFNIPTGHTTRLAIDDQIIMGEQLNGQGVVFDSSKPVTTRVLGTWRFEQGADNFQSVIFINNGDFSDVWAADPVTINWNKANANFTTTIGNFSLNFEVRVTPFADPNPTQDADCDLDGIIESVEARNASRVNRFGDPGKRDVLLAVGFTHPDWKLTRKSKGLLTTIFAQNNVNLTIATQPSDVVGITPGQINLPGVTEDRATNVALSDLAGIRGAHISAPLNSVVHFLVLTETITPGSCGGQSGSPFGCGGQPGLNLVVKSHLPIAGAEIGEYQAKTVMHELGHNLALCHPTDSPCISSPTLPVAERDPGLTCMGTPVEDGGLINPAAIINAFRRPLNYTPTQWTNLDLRISTGLTFPVGC